MSTFKASDFIHPKFWPTWLALGALRLIVLLPFSWQIHIGKSFGAILYSFMTRRKRIGRINLKLCFPDKSEQEREKILKDTFANMGMAFIEMAITWWWSKKRVATILGQIDGLEHLETALKKGKGAILITGHYTCLEMGAFLVSLQNNIQVMYKNQSNPLLHSYLLHKRKRNFIDAFVRYDLRGMVKGIKKNRIAWYAPDQDFGEERTVFAPFFGIPTSTLTSTARMAKMTGAPLLPFTPYRDKSGLFYSLKIDAPLASIPSGDDLADATLINQSIEAAVRENPSQYMWLHRRFKSRPNGEGSVY